MSTGSKGDPDAKMHFPSVHSKACSAVHSALVVGLDRGKMIGRSTWFVISRIKCSENNPPTAVTPNKIVGLYFFTTSKRGNSLSSLRANGFCSGVNRSILSVPSNLITGNIESVMILVFGILPLFVGLPAHLFFYCPSLHTYPC